MPAAEGAFPKSGGDPPYASEYNAMNYYTFQQNVGKMYSSIETVGTNNFINTDTKEIRAKFNNFQSGTALTASAFGFPRIRTDLGSLFISNIVYSNTDVTKIMPYVRYDTLSIWDELDNSVVNTGSWFSGGDAGTVTEGADGMIVTAGAGTKWVQMSGTNAFPIQTSMINFGLNIGNNNTTNTGIFLIGSGDTGSVLIVDGNNSPFKNTEKTYNFYLKPTVTARLENISSSGASWTTTDISALGSPYQLSLNMSNNGASSTLRYLRFFDTNATYTSSATIKATADNKVNLKTIPNGGVGSVIVGKELALQVEFAPSAGSEVMKMYGWGIRWS